MGDETTKQPAKRQRTCIWCGKQADKHALHRVVRSAEGVVAFDPSGRAPGRGAYVCSGECFAQAAKAQRFNRALRAKIDEQDLMSIEAELASRDAGGKR